MLSILAQDADVREAAAALRGISAGHSSSGVLHSCSTSSRRLARPDVERRGPPRGPTALVLSQTPSLLIVESLPTRLAVLAPLHSRLHVSRLDDCKTMMYPVYVAKVR